MTGFDITETSAPWVVFVPEGAAEVQRQLRDLEAKGGGVHHFAAADLMTEQAVHRAFAESFRFPGYYGHNWDALVDCLDDLCGAVTRGVGVAGVVHDADALLEAEHFPLWVSVLCQGADRANAAVDLDGDPLDRPAVAEHFVFEFRAFDREKVALKVRQPDLIVTTGDGFVAAALDPDEWH
ncbi:barstar family protein [Streptomyces sp. G44]|uniref:barstar family protein n=1 Tax=Streptomyces sp. G44 TaxID=2807632 RepID=UPI00195F46EA|nr:barstar family protein [Streptomyces sp. G44]MBM7169946.1 barstar family protein [Streptomyces sp. G44]